MALESCYSFFFFLWAIKEICRGHISLCGPFPHISGYLSFLAPGITCYYYPSHLLVIMKLTIDPSRHYILRCPWGTCCSQLKKMAEHPSHLGSCLTGVVKFQPLATSFHCNFSGYPFLGANSQKTSQCMSGLAICPSESFPPMLPLSPLAREFCAREKSVHSKKVPVYNSKSSGTWEEMREK